MNELNKLEDSKSEDVVAKQELRNNINFCDSLLNKDENIIEELRYLIAKRGKSKEDNSIVSVRDRTCQKFVNSISVCLFPDILDWITKNPYEVGKFISNQIKGERYNTEGGSREGNYIVIYDDSHINRLIRSDELQTFLVDSAYVLTSSRVENNELYKIIWHLISTREDIDVNKAEEWINYFSKPSMETTKEIMRGLIT